jgi:hypothetical protein
MQNEGPAAAIAAAAMLLAEPAVRS